jgi:hypothetical protein
MKVRLLALALLLITIACKSQDTCPKVKITDFPKKDLPPQNFNSEKLKFKASENYYYGIGVPIDYVTARYLAFTEMAGSEGEPALGGSTVLMMLYANGYGVKRDYDISIRLACANVGFAPAEVTGRMQHLRDMKAGKSSGVFDVCDDITSGYMGGYCESIISDKNKYRRQAIIDSVIGKLPNLDTALFNKLQATATKFFEARSGNEVDLSGTARAAFELAESDGLEKGFLDKVLKTGKCDFTKYSADDFKKADDELNAIYVKVMHVANMDGWGTVTKAGIKSAEIKWIPYKEAWLAFGKKMCPEIPEYTWETILTQERTLQLKQFLPQ